MELRDPRPAYLTDLDAADDERPFADRTRDLLTGGEPVPQSVTPPSGHPRFPLVDGVRAIAALAVVTTHAGFAANAPANEWYGRFTARLDVGVAIFFAVAGFLLFRPYLAEHVDGVRAPSFGRYLFRRGLRVLPAYWVALTVLAVIGLVTLDSRFWEQYALVQVYDRDELFGGIVPAWSLATEVLFYLLLPFFVVLLRLPHAESREARLRGAAWLAAALWVAAVVFRLGLRHANGGQASVWFNALPGTLDWFALGMGLAVVSVAVAHGSWRPWAVVQLQARPGLSWAGALGLFAIVSLTLGREGAWAQSDSLAGWLAMHVLYGGIAVLVLAPAVFAGAQTLTHAFLAHPIVNALGIISYGVFLYNGPVIVWLSRSQLSGIWAGKPFLGILLAALVITIPAAALSYRLIERPLLRFKDANPLLSAGAARDPANELDRPAG